MNMEKDECRIKGMREFTGRLAKAEARLSVLIGKTAEYGEDDGVYRVNCFADDYDSIMDSMEAVIQKLEESEVRLEKLEWIKEGNKDE